jgi:hypothetical protein
MGSPNGKQAYYNVSHSTAPPLPAVSSDETILAYWRQQGRVLEEVVSNEDVSEDQGVRILSPLLGPGLLLYALYLCVSTFELKQDYTYAEVCPATQRLKMYLIAKDAAVYNTFLRASLTSYCLQEDSFYQFFLNLYVRDLVSTSDSWTLLLYDVRCSFVPWGIVTFFLYGCARAYALLAFTVTTVESWVLPRLRVLLLISQCLAAIPTLGQHFLALLSDALLSCVPLPTMPTSIPSTHVLAGQGLAYRVGRHTRYIAYHNSMAQATLMRLFLISLSCVFLARYCCLLDWGVGFIEPVLMLLTWGGVAVPRHQELFSTMVPGFVQVDVPLFLAELVLPPSAAQRVDARSLYFMIVIAASYRLVWRFVGLGLRFACPSVLPKIKIE